MPAAQSMMDFLYGRKLTNLIQSQDIREGLPNPLGKAVPELYQVSRQVMGDKVEWEETTGQRQTSQLTSYGSASKSTQSAATVRRSATMIHSNENLPFDQQILNMLMLTENPMALQAAQQESVRKVRYFVKRFENTRVVSVPLALRQGNIYWDKDGNMLPTSSGSVGSVSYNLPAGNTFTKNSGTFSLGDWSSSSTDIPGAMQNFDALTAQANNYECGVVLYGKNIPGYLFKNDAIGKMIQYNLEANRSALQQGIVPNGFMGKLWVPVSKMYMLNAAGTPTALFGANDVCLLPEVNETWYEYVEGSTLIPTGIATTGQSFEQMKAGVQVAYGQYSYCEMTTDPISIKMIAGDTHLPIIKVPGVVYNGVVA